MKRVNNVYKNTYKLENIIETYNKQIRVNTKNKRKIENFEDYYSINITNVQNILETRNYIPNKYNIFAIYEPKFRIVMSQTIRDKLINHLVAKHILVANLEKSLIESNIATRKNKGTHYGLKLIKKYLNEIKNKTDDIYFLKFDINKYFCTIDHNIVKKQLKNKIKDKEALQIIDTILCTTNLPYINESIIKIKQKSVEKVMRANLSIKDKEERIKKISKVPLYEKDKGLPIGNMTSQIIAIYYLNELDHFIKEELKIKYYCRYMDDGILIHHNKEYLNYCLREIERKLEQKFKLKLNSKTCINHIKNGLDFLGFRFYLKNKKIILKVRNDCKKRFKKKMKKIKILIDKKKISKKEAYQVIASYKGHLLHGSSRTLFDKYTKDL